MLALGIWTFFLRAPCLQQSPSRLFRPTSAGKLDFSRCSPVKSGHYFLSAWSLGSHFLSVCSAQGVQDLGDDISSFSVFGANAVLESGYTLASVYGGVWRTFPPFCWRRWTRILVDVPVIMQRRCSLEQWKCLRFSSSPDLVDIPVRNRDGHVSACGGGEGAFRVFPHFSCPSGLSRS